MHRFIFFLSCVFLATKASDVLEFTDSDFKSKIQDTGTTLVEFFAPWCGHCKRLAPEYETAATRLKGEDPPVSLVKVDCTANTEICGEHGVSGYPTLKIFKNGEFSKDYQGPREADGIVKAMLKEVGPASKELKDDKAFQKFRGGEGSCVVGFFKDADSKEAKAFQKLADSYEDLRFAHTYDSSLQSNLKYDNDVVLFRPKAMENKFEDSALKFTGDATDSSKVRKFLEEESFGLCAHRTQSNAGKFKNPLFVAFFDVDYKKNPKGTNYWRNRVMKIAKKLKDAGLKAFFAISDVEDHSQELEECGAKGASDKPVVCAYDEKSRKYNMKEEFSMDTFEKFARDVLDGKVEPYLKSEEIPVPNDEPVKIAVGKNFEDLVNDETKDVLIEFYAPWCGHCKSLAPKYDELAEKLKDETDIVIAKMDATANDVPTPYDVRGFPTIYFSPKGKPNPRKYEGGREVDDFLKYLAKESTDELKGWDRKGKKKGGKKKKSEL